MCNKLNKLKIAQAYAPTTSYSEEYINSFTNDIGETLWKQNHYTIVKGDINAQKKKITNPIETATGKSRIELKNGRGKILVEWAIS